jgi:hypothetical protein
LTIDAAREEVCVDAYQGVVYGHTTFPSTGKEVSFAYVCAPIRYLNPDSLPWEK